MEFFCGGEWQFNLDDDNGMEMGDFLWNDGSIDDDDGIFDEKHSALAKEKEKVKRKERLGERERERDEIIKGRRKAFRN